MPKQTEARRTRMDLGLTQTDMASVTAQTPQTISRLDRGVRKLRGPALIVYRLLDQRIVTPQQVFDRIIKKGAKP